MGKEGGGKKRATDEIYLMTVNRSMVVKMFCPNVVKLACGNGGSGITSLCDGDVSWLLQN